MGSSSTSFCLGMSMPNCCLSPSEISLVVVPTVPDLSGCGDPEICPRSAVKKAYQNKYPTDAFIIYPDGRHYLAINTFEWLEDEKLFIYVDQGPEEQAFETFFKTCYATK